MAIERTCELTGKNFVVCDTEIALREMLGVPLPTVHPYERQRELLTWRNLFSLYPYECDACKRSTLTFFNPTNTFPKYCRLCYFSDSWIAPQQEIDFSRPFFD